MAFTLRSGGGGFYGIVDWGSGWLSQNEVSSSWIYFELYMYKNVRYLKVNTPGSSWNGYYLSVNKNGYLGLYGWSGATGWDMTSDGILLSCYNGQPVGVEDINQARYFKADPSMNIFRFEREYNADLYVALGK